MKLKNKVAFITGGTSGIGLEAAKLFQAEGAQLVLVSSNAERLAAAGKELGGNALLVRADIRKVADIERAVEETRARFVASTSCSPMPAPRRWLRWRL